MTARNNQSDHEKRRSRFHMKRLISVSPRRPLCPLGVNFISMTSRQKTGVYSPDQDIVAKSGTQKCVFVFFAATALNAILCGE
jgi:hypothetical protein